MNITTDSFGGIKVMSARHSRCMCVWCERGRFIRRLRWRMLPWDWKKLYATYSAILDDHEEMSMEAYIANRKEPAP